MTARSSNCVPPRPTRFGQGKRIHVAKPTGGELYVAFAFAAPGMNRQERVLPLDMAQFILGQGRASTLYQNIKEKRGLCSSISSFYPTHMGDSLFVVAATCLPEQQGPLREAITQELQRFVETVPEEPAMRRAFRLQASAHRFSMETTGSAATNVGYYYTLAGETGFLDTYLERLERVTDEDVREATIETVQPGELEQAMVEVSVGPDGAEA